MKSSMTVRMSPPRHRLCLARMRKLPALVLSLPAAMEVKVALEP